MAQVGDLVRINWMDGEPDYAGREGRITRIDSMGHLHGTWGGLAILPEDSYTVIPEAKWVPQ